MKIIILLQNDVLCFTDPENAKIFQIGNQWIMATKKRFFWQKAESNRFLVSTKCD